MARHRNQSRRLYGVEPLERRVLLATYYVDAFGGNDANSGMSTSDAWATVARVNNQSFTPGDSVLFRRGGSWDGELELNGQSGTALLPITVGAYGGGASPLLERLYVRNASDHVVVENLIVDHRKQSGDAVRVRSSSNVVLRDLEVRNGTSDGIDFSDADGITFDGLHVHHFLAGSFTNQQDAHGIVGTDTDGVTIRNTEIHHVSGDSFQADPDRDTQITTNVLIEDSHFWTSPLNVDFNSQWFAGQRPGENAIDTKVVTSGWNNVPRMRIEVRNVVAHGWVADGFISNRAAFNMKEQIEAVFDGVTVYDNEIGFRIRGTRGNANVTMQNVVMYNHDKAIRAEDDLQNLTILNSTFGANNSQMIQLAGGGGGVGSWDLRNNAFSGGVPIQASDPSNLLAVDADFEDIAGHDYRPAAGSQLVDTGLTIASVTHDRNGIARPQLQGHDVGAYERTTVNYVDWGTVDFLAVTDQSNSGEMWYRVQPTRSGLLTVEALFDQGQGNLVVELLDNNLAVIAAGQSQANGARAEASVSDSDVVYVKVTGTHSNVDYRLNNLVSPSGNTVNVAGTNTTDTFVFNAGASHQLDVNGTPYLFDPNVVDAIEIVGGTGADQISLTGNGSDDTAILRVGSTTLQGVGYTVAANGIEVVSVDGGGGTNTAHLYDAPGGNDTFVARRSDQRMTGAAYDHRALGFRNSFGYSTGGTDNALLHDGADDDRYTTWHNQVSMAGSDFYNYAWNFANTSGYASSGNDTAVMRDSAGNDQYQAWHDRASMTGDGFDNYVEGFDRTFAYSSTGNDSATAYDSTGDDQFVSWPDLAVMSGNNFYNWIKSFATTTGQASAGDDVAILFDSSGNDRLVARHNRAVIEAAGVTRTAAGFERTFSYASTGNDVSIMVDSAGDDRYIAFPDRVMMIGDSFLNHASDFGSTFAYASLGGSDEATLYDSSGDDMYVTQPDRATLHGNGFYNLVEQFDATHAFASGGFDSAVMYDSGGSDTYTTYYDRVLMAGDNFYNLAHSFDNTFGYASGGNDRALMFDSANDDFYQTWHDHVVMQGSGYYNYAAGFTSVFGFASHGNDLARMYDSVGDDHVDAAAWGVAMRGIGYYNDARDFDVVEAHGIHGGSNTATTEVIDYQFSLIGDWSLNS